MIGIVVRFDVRDEAAGEVFDELTAEVLVAIEAEEPGTQVYATQRLRDDPLARVFFEVYADEEAFAAHEAAPHVRSFHARKDPLLSGPPRVEFFLPGPAKGLPARESSA